MVEKFGDCAVEQVLGAGNAGTVYLVRSPAGEQFALKVLNPEIARLYPEFKHRFMREAEFAMTLHHRNLIPVHDAGEDPERGFCYILMDYLPGGSVKERVRAQGRLPVEKAVSIAISVAGALEVAHYHGVVHRDIKSENILFDADGTPKLADLGVARFKDDTHPGTMRGGILGTPAYMAPEQMLDSHSVDIRADIYSFGVMLHELLTGRRPNEGEGAMRTLAKAIEGRAFPDVRRSRPDTPAELAVLVSEMTLPDADQRPQSARLVLDLLTHPDRIPTGDDIPERVPWYKDRYVLYAATGMALALEALVLAIVKAVRGV